MLLFRTAGTALTDRPRNNHAGLAARSVVAVLATGLAVGAAAESRSHASIRNHVPADYSIPDPRYSKPHHLLIEPCSDPEQFYSAEDPRKTIAANEAYHAACQQTANDIIAAVPKWKEAMTVLRRQDVAWAQGEIPSYIGEELAVRAAGIESDMGRLERNKGTYEGLYQFSRTNRKSLLFMQMDYMLATLNAGRDNIPVLKGLKVPRITQKELLTDAVFYDHTAQVYLKLTSAYVADQKYAHDSEYQRLTSREKMTLGYVSHLLPVVENFLIKHHECDHKVNEFKFSLKGRLRKISRKIFRLNSGMFQHEGEATARNIVSRFNAITTPYLTGFAPSVYRPAGEEAEASISRHLSVEKSENPAGEPSMAQNSADGKRERKHLYPSRTPSRATRPQHSVRLHKRGLHKTQLG